MRPPLPFFKNQKKCPDFGKKVLIVSIFVLSFSIQDVVLRVLGEKNSKIFACGAFFSCAFDEMFIEVPKFHETSFTLKNFWLRACKPKELNKNRNACLANVHGSMEGQNILELVESIGKEKKEKKNQKMKKTQ